MGAFSDIGLALQSQNVEFSFGLVLRAIGVIGLLGLAKFFHRLHQVRMTVRRVTRENGVRIMPHYYLLGHFPHIVKMFIKNKYPADISGQIVGQLLAKEHPEYVNDGVFYIDTWPISPPLVWVSDPDMMYQFCQDPSFPKGDMLYDEFRPFTHLKDLLTLEGAEWKRWRAVYNPGFSAKNLLSLIPLFLEEIKVFTDALRRQAKTGEVRIFLDQAMDLTYDVIARATLDTRLHCQTTPNTFKWAMNKQTSWVITDLSLGNFLKLINPFRLAFMGHYNKVMADYLTPIIQGGVAEYGSEDSKSKPKTINSLAITAYLSEKGPEASAKNVDKDFTESVIAQMKMFMLAGHDTTASTLAFAFSLLEQNPSALAALRAEHEAVFGPDPSTTEAQIAASPQILNSLPYALAVIKETLRLYPPVGSARQGMPGAFLTHPKTGNRYPVFENFMLFSCSIWEQRREEFWPRASEFLPERFLAREGDELYVGKNKFRPFELGPRGCIGQELALLEMKAILALTIREFEITTAYGEDDPEFWGTKTYQVMEPGQVAGRPRKGMPFRVRLLEKKE